MLRLSRNLNNRQFSRFFVPGIFLLGLVLRLGWLDARSLWYDEVLSVETAQRGISAILTDRFGWMRVQTPSHYLLIWLSAQIADPAVTAFFVRLPSALAGALTVPVVYGIGRELFGRAQGLLAALLVALSASFLDYSQDLRPYAILTFLSCLAVYCLLMAQRTGSAGWWAGFAAATIADLLNAYVALTLFIPALAPYLLFVLWKLRPRKGTGGKPFLYALLSIAASAMVGVAVLLDMIKVPRIAPDLSIFSARAALASTVDLVTWFTRFGLNNDRLERLLQLVILALALYGAYAASRKGRGEGALLCGLLICVPATILAILSTTNTVFQRYALFALPFYFLLLSNVVVAALPNVLLTSRQMPGSRVQTASRAVLCAAIVSLFVAGDYVYLSPDGHSRLSFRPDYRAASAYLSTRARPDDLIIFAASDPTIGEFFWNHADPAPSYSFLDPRLFTQKPTGSIYWIASDQDLTAAMMRDPRWKSAQHFEGLVVLQENAQGADMVQHMSAWADMIEAATPNQHAWLALDGSIYQAQGDVQRAVAAYKSAGTNFPIGDEYLVTSQGFAERGQIERAWSDALVSKGQQPDKPAVHLWFAQILHEQGYLAESRVETQIAQALH